MSPSTPALWSLLARYWLTVWPLARRELRRWHRHAQGIPDAELRQLALLTHEQEHLNAEGAAIFAALAPWRLTAPLVRALVAYQVLFDYLDSVTEEPSSLAADARRLHRALTDAMNPHAPLTDGYLLHVKRDDGGYLAGLVDACRDATARLPAFASVAESASRIAARSGEVQALNHSAQNPQDALMHWAARYSPVADKLNWWEFAASASSSLGVHVLLAMAADRRTTPVRARDVARSYCVQLGALNTLLESLVDLPRDRATGEHSFASYYRDPRHAAARLSGIAADAQQAAASLPGGDRHMVVLAGMVSFYLSTAEAWLPHAEPASRATLTALGDPVPLLVRILRTRRTGVTLGRPVFR
jgi:tetraprenyl-beta-curcumene synthase